MVEGHIVPWFKAFPRRYSDEVGEVYRAFSGWREYRAHDLVILEGRFPIIHKGELIDQYRIRVEVPPNYPQVAPTVFEVDGVIPRLDDRHVNGNGSFCLFVPDERWKYFPIEQSSLLYLLQGPVYHFLLNQAYYDRTGEWLWKGREHGAFGRLEYYFEEFKTSDPLMVLEYLRAAMEPVIPRQRRCPCKSKRPIRKCHTAIFKVKANIPHEILASAKADIQEMVEKIKMAVSGQAGVALDKQGAPMALSKAPCSID